MISKAVQGLEHWHTNDNFLKYLFVTAVSVLILQWSLLEALREHSAREELVAARNNQFLMPFVTVMG